ncbi:hypothetical protein CBR_g88761 [Chara braunii]|uniref:Uncharacterized protein n=1 Tax=Chara braunii TaxID=69332 RepID=A0A388JK51_CHABU|nr:hypothetical protein CBR_g88761 [Chara braunii]|eukprot:GBG43875.1 hypothetical protein CBR_g88761 [Chara braunii]
MVSSPVLRSILRHEVAGGSLQARGGEGTTGAAAGGGGGGGSNKPRRRVQWGAINSIYFTPTEWQQQGDEERKEVIEQQRRMLRGNATGSKVLIPSNGAQSKIPTSTSSDIRPRQVCMCSPTNHAGSFRCRLHIQRQPAPWLRRPSSSSGSGLSASASLIATSAAKRAALKSAAPLAGGAQTH